MRFRFAVWCAVGWFQIALSSSTVVAQEPFTEEASTRGIWYGTFSSLITWGSGFALNDLDGDGDLDFVVTGDILGEVGVYENDGTGYFTPRFATGIPVNPGFSGVTAADYDGDGDLDLYLCGHQSDNALVRNDGNFQFTDVTVAAGVNDPGETMDAVWGDYDQDGWLDIYLVNHPTLLDYSNRLFRNLGDGTFEERTVQLGLTDFGPGFDGAFLDADMDGDQDLYVANDKGYLDGISNRYWRNDGGTFVDLGDPSGAGIGVEAMGIGLGEINGDGRPDLYITNTEQGNRLLLSEGHNVWSEDITTYGVGVFGTGWGARFFDYDLDGDEDLYAADTSTENLFFENTGAPPWVNRAADLGVDQSGYGYCVEAGDLDGDGDLDLVAQSAGLQVKVYINHEGNNRKWLALDLEGLSPNTFAVGARVKVISGGNTQWRQVYGTGTFRCSRPYRLTFGVDQADVVDEVTVYWPTGRVTTRTDVPTNQVLALEEAATSQFIERFRRGDTNGDGLVDVSDIVNSLNHLFSGAPMNCLAALDVNADTLVDISDSVTGLNRLFSVGPPSPLPADNSCQQDILSGLDCQSSGACP